MDEQRFINYGDVFQKKNLVRSMWKRSGERLNEECWPIVAPSFILADGAKVFTIGSCFARNIEENISHLGYEVPCLRFRAPSSEWTGRPNGILNKYTPPSIYQAIDWAAKIYRRDGVHRPSDSVHFGYETDAGWIDNGLGGFRPVSEQRFYERRSEVYDVFAEAFSAECVVITLGLVEAWYDASRELFLEQSPATNRALLGRADDFRFVQLEYPECLQFIEDAMQIIRELNQGVRFLITTSPVPLERTFTQDDVIIANTYSKSTLRSVCGCLAKRHDDVDYFPSFESVSMTRSWEPWKDDRMHVKESFVAKIVSGLCESYFGDVGEARRMMLASVVALEAEEHEESLAAIERSIELASDVLEYRVQRAKTLVGMHRFKDARAELDRVIDLDAKIPLAFFLRAAALESLKLDEAALADLESGLALVPGDIPRTLNYGRMLVRLDRCDEAVKLLRPLAMSRPNLAGAHFWLGSGLRGLGQYDDAIASIECALLLDPGRRAFVQGLQVTQEAAARAESSVPSSAAFVEDASETRPKGLRGLVGRLMRSRR